MPADLLYRSSEYPTDESEHSVTVKINQAG